MAIKDCIWVGLTDMKEEGNWTWVNGKPAVDCDISWDTDEPNRFDDENCGIIFFNLNSKIHDACCNRDCNGLCEKIPRVEN